MHCADLLSAIIMELERSRVGCKTRFRSPPKIKLYVSRLGKSEKRSLKNGTLSQLGAYTLARTTGMLKSLP